MLKKTWTESGVQLKLYWSHEDMFAVSKTSPKVPPIKEGVTSVALGSQSVMSSVTKTLPKVTLY